MRRTIAATELLLLFPSALFMTALFVRQLQPQPAEPAHTAQRIVMWFAAQPHVGLWLFLIALPLAVLAIGCTALARSWADDAPLRQTLRAHATTLLTAAATLASGLILAVVALHVLSD